jgi:hypothetical protein
MTILQSLLTSRALKVPPSRVIFGFRRCIPLSIARYGVHRFCGCGSLQNMTFESGSRFSRIDDHAFSGCLSLSSACPPCELEQMESFAPSETNLNQSSIEDRNSQFKVNARFLLDLECISIRTGSLQLEASYRGMGQSCFAKCASISSICIPSSVAEL